MLAPRAEPVDFDEVEVRQTIHQPAGRHRPDPREIVGVNRVDVPAGELPFLPRAVEHLVGVEVMHRAEHEIEPVPVRLDPAPAGGAGHGIVVQFDARADSHVRDCFAQRVDRVEIDARRGSGRDR